MRIGAEAEPYVVLGFRQREFDRVTAAVDDQLRAGAVDFGQIEGRVPPRFGARVAYVRAFRELRASAVSVRLF